MSTHKLEAYDIFDLCHSVLKRTVSVLVEFGDRGTEGDVALRSSCTAFARSIEPNTHAGKVALPGALSFLAAALTLSVGLDVNAQAYPSQSIRLLCGFSAGGGSDTIARIVARGLSARIDQQVIVENRPGAGGSIAAQAVVSSPGDGYTVLVGSTSQISINPRLYKKLPFDPLKDLAPVTMVATMPLVLVVHPSLPVRSVKGLIALAKARPGELSYGSAGIGTIVHLTMELFRVKTGINIVHIPYKGSAPAFVDLLAGRIQLLFSSLTAALPRLQGGRLRALAVTSSARTSQLPTIPTMREAGVADMEIQFWLGLFVPAGTPPNIVERLNHETTQALKSPEMIDILKKQGAKPGNLRAAQFTKFLQAEAVKWGEAVTLSGAKRK